MGFCVRLSSKVFYCGDFAELSRREEEALSYSALHGDDLLSKRSMVQSTDIIICSSCGV